MDKKHAGGDSAQSTRLSSSSTEAYGGVLIAILLAVVPMTWQVRWGFLFVFGLILVHLVWRSPFTVRLHRAVKWALSILMACLWLASMPYLKDMSRERSLASEIAEEVAKRLSKSQPSVAATSTVQSESSPAKRSLEKAQEPKYIPPKGPGIKVEGNFPVPSNQLCVGLSETDEIQCLCPRPVGFSLRSLPSPPDNNYATELAIKSVREPMYKVRVFSRTFISWASLLEASPYGDKKSVSAVWNMDYDKYSFVVTSSAPQSVFRVDVRTSQGLRIKCINQDN